MPTPTAPGMQVADGRLYQLGLVSKWARQIPAGTRFPLALKARQVYDTGWRAALADAVQCGVVDEIHVALIPMWNQGRPDWKWLEATAREVSLLAGSIPRIFARLGNYRDGLNEGTANFTHYALAELEFGHMLTEQTGGRLLWSVGDDRGMVGCVTGWKERKVLYGGMVPACIEVQAYGETGTTPGNVALLREAMNRNGFRGMLALVEQHRWFPVQGKTAGDLEELFTAATGEYLLQMWLACKASGISWMMFTGDYAFNKGGEGLNPAGLALFNKPRPYTKPWKAPSFQALKQSLRLRGE